jgi:histidinol-phosphatase (PHP family)
MLVDYHTHHYRCGHAQGRLEDYVEAAISAGLVEIGLSDHAPIYHLGADPHARPYTAMSQQEFPNYVAEVRALRERYKDRIKVRFGVESDYLPSLEEHYRQMWGGLDLDYVIGSVHWLNEWTIFDPKVPAGEDDWSVYQEYLRYTQGLARSGVFDIIGHLDCIKTRGHLPTREITPLLEETVRVIAESGTTVELNTSGWRKDEVQECYPRPNLLALCQHHGVPVTLSSDAHDPTQVTYAFERAVKLLRDVGYREIATFERRERKMIPLTEMP